MQRMHLARLVINGSTVAAIPPTVQLSIKFTDTTSTKRDHAACGDNVGMA